MKATLFLYINSIFVSDSKLKDFHNINKLKTQIQEILNDKDLNIKNTDFKHTEYLFLGFTDIKEKNIQLITYLLSYLIKYYEKERCLDFYNYVQYNNSTLPMNHENECLLNFIQNAYDFRSNIDISKKEIFDENLKIKTEYIRVYNDYSNIYFVNQIKKGPHHMLINNFSTDEKDHNIMYRLYSYLISTKYNFHTLQYNYFIVLDFKENSKIKSDIVGYILKLLKLLARKINNSLFSFGHLNLNNWNSKKLESSNCNIGAVHFFKLNDGCPYEKVDQMYLNINNLDYVCTSSFLTLPHIQLSILFDLKYVFNTKSNNIKQALFLLKIDNRISKVKYKILIEKKKLFSTDRITTNQRVYQILEIVSIYYKYNKKYILFDRFFSLYYDGNVNDVHISGIIEKGNKGFKNFMDHVRKIYNLNFIYLNFYMSRYISITHEFIHLSHFNYDYRAYIVSSKVNGGYENFMNITKSLHNSKKYKFKLHFFESKLIKNDHISVGTNSIQYFYNRLKICRYINNNDIVIESYSKRQAITIVMQTYNNNKQSQYVFVTIPISLLLEINRINFLQKLYLQANTKNFDLNKKRIGQKHYNIVIDIIDSLVIYQPSYFIEQVLKHNNFNYMLKKTNIDMLIISYLIKKNIVEDSSLLKINFLNAFKTINDNENIPEIINNKAYKIILKQMFNYPIFETIRHSVLMAINFFYNKLKKEYKEKEADFNRVIYYVSPGKTTYDEELLNYIKNILKN